jgi:hypothetical protein
MLLAHICWACVQIAVSVLIGLTGGTAIVVLALYLNLLPAY